MPTHPSFLQRLFVPVPAEYRAEFEQVVFAENALRLTLSGVVIASVELLLVLAAILATPPNYTPRRMVQTAIVVFNVILLTALWHRNRQGVMAARRPPRWAWLAGLFYVLAMASLTLMADLDTLTGIKAQNFAVLEVSLYVGTIYGLAFLYLPPAQSLLMYVVGYVLYVGGASYLVAGNALALPVVIMINAFGLNCVAWFASRLIFKSRLQTFIAQYKNEALLRNILPEKVVRELQDTGHTTPERFDQVTVLFADLVDFTTQASQLPPQQLIAELNDLFSAFDALCAQHGCERLKTIGDAYLCVGGMPEPTPHHAVQVTRVALGMVAFLMQRNQTHPVQWQIRIGLHSGEVVGGVVGVTKYVYDVFGDTVNIASRVQSHSLPMRVNLSAATYALVKDTFPCEPRGLIAVKGKGEMAMYFVEKTGAMPQAASE